MRSHAIGRATRLAAVAAAIAVGAVSVPASSAQVASSIIKPAQFAASISKPAQFAASISKPPQLAASITKPPQFQ